MLITVLGWSIVLYYLDDFLAILLPYQNPQEFSNQFDKLTAILNIQVNSKEDITGITAEFLDIEIDTMKIEARLSEEKLQRAK